MREVRNLFFLLIALFILSLKASAQTDSSPHKVQFVTVEEGVQLEVPDRRSRPLRRSLPAGSSARHREFGDTLSPTPPEKLLRMTAVLKPKSKPPSAPTSVAFIR